MKKQLFNVAGILFSVRMAADDSLWGCMDNYLPFQVEDEGEGQSPVFTLQVKSRCDAHTSLSQLVDTEGWENFGPYDSEDIVMSLRRSPDGSRYACVMAVTWQPSARVLILFEHHFTQATLWIQGNERIAHFGLNNALMFQYACATATMGRLLIHASVIENEGRGYLFLGKSGTGKSTHSRLWLSHVPGSELLNDDNPVIGLDADGKVFVSGSPWSGKTPCYRNRRCPIGGFVRLWQAPENRIRTLKAVEAYAALLPTVSNMKWERRLADGANVTLEAMVKQVTFLELFCLPNAEAAHLSHSTFMQQ